ncbi:hypothetical protein HQ587_05140 [bacterium]|nr:hypothetical protein [bacterium]
MIVRITILSLILIASSLRAGPAEEAWEAYLAGDFELVERIVIKAKDDIDLDSTQLGKLHLALGCSQAMRGMDAAAMTSFEMALLFDRSIDLSPTDLPPPVWKLFKPVHDRMLLYASTLPTGVEITDPKFSDERLRIDTLLIVEPLIHEPSATLKSLVFPGWGHLSEGRNSGFLFTGIEAAALTGLLISTLAADRARDDYLTARSEPEISDRYSTYNRYYQLSWGFALIAISNYLIAQVDFFTTSPPNNAINALNSNDFSITLALKM